MCGPHPRVDPRAIEDPEAAVEGSDTVRGEADSTAVKLDQLKPAKRRRWFRRNVEAASLAPGPDGSPEPAPEGADAAEADIVERKPVGRRLAVTAAVAAALFVAAGAFGGAMLEPYLADRVVKSTKINIVKTATDAITTMFTYTPDDMGQLSARSAKYLGGELKDSYAKQVDALTAANKQSQIHRNVQVVGAAVESLQGNDATAMVYANITYTSAQTKDVPRIFLVAYRLSMERKGADWLITKMPWITSKDLTRL
jgi:Mce-associated membrane protein